MGIQGHVIGCLHPCRVLVPRSATYTSSTHHLSDQHSSWTSQIISLLSRDCFCSTVYWSSAHSGGLGTILSIAICKSVFLLSSSLHLRLFYPSKDPLISINTTHGTAPPPRHCVSYTWSEHNHFEPPGFICLFTLLYMPVASSHHTVLSSWRKLGHRCYFFASNTFNIPARQI